MKQFKDIFTIDAQEIIIKERPSSKPSLFKEAFKLSLVIIVVITLSWSISLASKSDLESANDNFSVIGTVSFISEDTVSLIKARGSDTTAEELYNLNIQYLDKIETNTYDPLIISDIKVGDTIIAQGLTNGSTFFIKRIVSFSSIPFEKQEDLTATTTATSTEDLATSTEEIATSTESETGGASIEPTPDTATSTDTIATTTEELPLITEPATTTQEATSTPTLIDTVTDIVDTVIIGATDIVENIVDIITGTSTPEEVIETPQPLTEEPEQSPQEEPVPVPDISQ